MPDRLACKSCSFAVQVGIALWSVFLSCVGAEEPEPGWKPRVSSVVITPERPTLMCGGISHKPSEGKIHDLYAKAPALEGAQGTRLVIVAIERGRITGEHLERVLELLSSAFSGHRSVRVQPEGLTYNSPGQRPGARVV